MYKVRDEISVKTVTKLLSGLKCLTFIFITFHCSLSTFAQDNITWYEYRLKQMTLDEKIGQLFMVSAYTNRDTAHTAEIERLISNYHIGGLIFFQNDPLKQAYMTNYYQSLAKTPLMIGIDGEWGLAMRLDNTFKFPYQITLGSIQHDSLIFEMGVQMAQQCKRLGIHINFAPDVDINNNPDNPIIGFRSFGEDKYKVARKGWMYAAGMQSENVLACAKHFPGHGDVNTDSHLDLPVINKTKAEIDSLELYPFRYLIDRDVASVMVAHINFPLLDNRPNRSTSLSKPVITDILKTQLGFNGLVFTDALNMKGITKFYAPGMADVEALLAGSDVLLCPENVPVATAMIKQAIAEGKITEAELDRHVKKILKWKEWAGLAKYKPVELKNLKKDLLPKASAALNDTIAREAVCVVKDEGNILPFNIKDHVACLTIGDDGSYAFNERVHKLVKYPHFSMKKGATNAQRLQLQKKLKTYHTIVVSLHNSKVWNNKTFGFNQSDLDFINTLDVNHNVILVPFCSPYVLKHFPNVQTVVLGYENGEEFQTATADVICGKRLPKGVLPVSVSPQFRAGMGLFALSRKTVSNYKPNADGIDTAMLTRMDAIANQIIASHAAPGCRLLVLKNGKPYYDKAFGYYTYDNKVPVTKQTTYDIASVSKIAGTTLAIMKLHEEGKLHLHEHLETYLPEAKGTNKAHLQIQDILTHQAGLTAWIPFYKETLAKFDSMYSAKPDSLHTIPVAHNLYLLKSERDTIMKRIYESKLESRIYRYSDLSMILMQQVVEHITGMPLDSYVYQNFYVPMGLSHIGYKPYDKFNISMIAPTQNDLVFRRQWLQGYVHDPGCAMLGGVCGHAGVFADAGDLAAIMQMLTNGGTYQGKQYLKPETVKQFTKYHSTKSRRGLGFDKPDFSGKTSPASLLCSEETFGHTGFTGTCAWADPKYNLVFIFLSNRICPDEENKNLINGNYRIKIQDALYESVGR